MSKNEEIKYKKYLYNNFTKLINYVDDNSEYNNNWYNELIAYNNIMGSLIGLIDSKGTGKDFQNCKDFVLRYYESTYPKKQLEAVDDALYSKDCFEYINYAVDNLVCNKIDLDILRSFSISYLKGYNLGNDVSLNAILPYYAKKIHEYTYMLNSKENQKLYQI